MLESSIQARLSSFTKLTNQHRKELFELYDLAAEVSALMEDEKLRTTFSYFNSSLGVNRFVCKLPYALQEKWTTSANAYKLKNQVTFPPFTHFVNFLNNVAEMRNDPGFIFDSTENKPHTDKLIKDVKSRTNRSVLTMKTEVSRTQRNLSDSKDKDIQSEEMCPLHMTSHKLNACRAFRSKPISERLEFLKQKGLCFKCCGPKKYFRDKCTGHVKCCVCSSSNHPSALHVDTTQPRKNHEGEETKDNVNNSCTEICDTPANTSKSCAEIVLVSVHHQQNPQRFMSLYCVVDDQSNRTLATSNFFNFFGENSGEAEYVLSSCAGKFAMSGRRASGYVVSSYDGSSQLNLPNIIECNEIPNNREEIPSSAIAARFPHMVDIAQFIPEINSNSEIDLLIGRDLISAHHVLDHRIGDHKSPYVQRIPLGWVIIGNVCLGKIHEQDVVNVNKTTVLQNGRPTTMTPCKNKLFIHPVFTKTRWDEQQGLSIEDKAFLDVMDSGLEKLDNGHWVAPLPFKPNRPILANNRVLAERRAKSFDRSLQHNPVKRQQVLDFMQKLFDSGHAEKTPLLSSDSECWYQCFPFVILRSQKASE